jgi:hypothetical protein
VTKLANATCRPQMCEMGSQLCLAQGLQLRLQHGAVALVTAASPSARSAAKRWPRGVWLGDIRSRSLPAGARLAEPCFALDELTRGTNKSVMARLQCLVGSLELFHPEIHCTSSLKYLQNLACSWSSQLSSVLFVPRALHTMESRTSWITVSSKCPGSS